MVEDDVIIDDEYHQKEEGLTFKDLVMKHVKEIMKLSTHEFTSGWWMVNVDENSGKLESRYNEDTCECYINSVQALADILHFHFDDEMKEKEKKIKEELKEIHEENKDKKQNRVFNPLAQELPGADEYSLKSRSIYRKLFRHLMDFVGGKRYFKGRTLQE